MVKKRIAVKVIVNRLRKETTAGPGVNLSFNGTTNPPTWSGDWAARSARYPIATIYQKHSLPRSATKPAERKAGAYSHNAAFVPSATLKYQAPESRQHGVGGGIISKLYAKNYPCFGEKIKVY